MSEGSRQRPRLRVGLTGGVASGKSTVARRFAELGVPVVDADVAARTVTAPKRPALAAIAARFGPQILTPQGELNRRTLRQKVFADIAARHDLEAILHPLIRVEMERLGSLAHGPYLVLSVPLLVEAGDARIAVDRILVVDTDEEAQLSRVQARDGCSEREARAIVAAQASRAERLRAADDVLENTANIAVLHAAVDRLHARYLAMAAASSR
jgi:dephospho-CoA kinase